MIGTTIDGRYRIIRELGAGAMGAVYEAEHSGTGGRVALKVITGDLARNPEAVSRFQREAKAAGVVDTQYVTKVYDTGVDRESGVLFLVMEFLAGQDFSGFLKRTAPIAPDLGLRVVAQACLGLQKAHEAKVVHRDIKPANMFLARREEGEVVVKLLDFGIAKMKMEQAQETETGGLTKTGSMLGTPFFMSPEQALGTKDVDHRADIWSLGVVLYQALTGRTPFGHITALGQLIVEITSGRLIAVQELAPWVPPQVAAIVHGSLRRDRNARFQSAAEMFAAIRPLLPHGWSIHESMLVPLPVTARAQVQPRLPMSSVPSLPEISMEALSLEGTPASQRSVSPGVTAGTMVRSHAALDARPSIKATIALGAALVTFAGMGVTGGYLLLRKPPPVTVAPPPAKTSLPEPATAAPPPPPPAPSAAPAPSSTATSEPALQRVELVIVPADASVEVEGKRVQPKNGLVEITGTHGSIHRVRVFKYKYETITDVIITAVGPKPPKVELSYSAPRREGGGPATPGQPAPPPERKRTTFE